MNVQEETFWGSNENEKEKTDKLNEDLFLKPTRVSDLEKEIELIKENLDYMEIIRARQIERLVSLQEDYAAHMNPQQYQEYLNFLKVKGKSMIALSEPETGILKVELNYLLPHYPKTKNTKLAYYVALSEVYQTDLIRKLTETKHMLPNFKKSEKVFVLIVQYFKSNMITDLDNRFHSFIFNALRSAQVIPDDRWQRLSYMEEGRIAESTKTEIFIADYERVHEVLHIANKL